nr:hypothetical protein [Propionicimonas sp.]
MTPSPDVPAAATDLANPAEGLRLHCPGAWSPVDPGVEGLALAAVADGDPASGFRPTVVVSRSTVGTLSLPDWEAGTEALLAERLTGYLLLDGGASELAGGEASYRLATYVNDAGMELTAQQWSTIVATQGLSLTVTCATDDFPEFRESSEAIAASLRWEAAR